VRDAVAFLAAATTRLAINVTQSARARRETHIGTWLPEPVDIEADLAHSAERAEALDRRCSCSSRTCLPSNEPPTCSAKRSTTPNRLPQRFMAKRAGATITSVHFSHASPVSHRPSRDPAHPARRSPSSLTTPTPARRHGVSQQFTLDPSSPSPPRLGHVTGPDHVINSA